MARRNRSRQNSNDAAVIAAGGEAKVKRPTYQGVPLEAIKAAATIYEDVHCKIFRRNPNGRLGGLGSMSFKVHELADIVEWLKTKAGGGLFFVDPRRVDNTLEYADPLPCFEVFIEGAPKPATAREHGLDMQAGLRTIDGLVNATPASSGSLEDPMATYPAGLTAADFASLPEWLKSQPVEHQISFLRQRRPEAIIDPNLNPALRYNAPVATVTSDQIALKQLEMRDAELAAERAKNEQQRRSFEEQMTSMRLKLESIAQASAKTEQEAKTREMEAKFEARIAELKTAMVATAPPPKQMNFAEIATLITAAAPIVTAIISSGATKQQTLVEQQTKSFEMQMANVNALLGKAGQSQDSFKGLVEGIVKLGPLLAPLFGDFLKSKNPSEQARAQADLWSTMSENQLNSMLMIAQLTEQLAKNSSNGEQPWYMPIVSSALEGITALTQKMTEAQKVQFQSAAGPQQQAAQQQQQQQRQRTPGENVAAMILNSPAVPQEMKTDEWFHLLSMLHDQEDVEAAADFAAAMLERLEEAGKIPAFLVQEYQTDPQQALTKLVAMLPIAQHNAAYANKFVETLVGLLTTEEEEEVETQGEEVSSAPAPEAPAAAAPQEQETFNLGQAQFDDFKKSVGRRPSAKKAETKAGSAA